MTTARTPGLLVSVRSAEEAAAAVEAGADIIDVKDPTRGPLAPAEAETVAAVLEVVAGRVPVSAALGEWSPNAMTDAHWHLELGVNFIKWGLAGYHPAPGWGEDLLDTRRLVPARIEVVLVAYADFKKAKSVPPAEVFKFGKRYRYRTILLDTWGKDGKTLLDHLSADEVAELVAGAQAGGAKVAVGGSLKFEQLKTLKAAAPDWFAVRGGICAGGTRDGVLDPGRVRKWKDALSK